MLAVVTVDTNLDTVDFNDGVTSLREALFATNLIGGDDTIDFDAALDGQTILLTAGELAITDALTIDASSLASGLTIDASGNDPTPDQNNDDGSRVLNIDNGNSANDIDVILSGLTLTGGDVLGDGGAILSRENLTITGSTISGNSAVNSGGIRSDGTTTTICPTPGLRFSTSSEYMIIGRPRTSMNAFGSPPMRSPEPAATTIATASPGSEDMEFGISDAPLTIGPTGWESAQDYHRPFLPRIRRCWTSQRNNAGAASAAPARCRVDRLLTGRSTGSTRKDEVESSCRRRRALA